MDIWETGTIILISHYEFKRRIANYILKCYVKRTAVIFLLTRRSDVGIEGCEGISFLRAVVGLCATVSYCIPFCGKKPQLNELKTNQTWFVKAMLPTFPH